VKIKTEQKSPSVTRISDRSLEAWENSEAYAALKVLKANPRINAIIIAAPANACPLCQELTGTYPKDQVPPLPIDSCSHPLGCRAFYMPVIQELYP
jgi:hypothetical protein